MPKRTVRGFGMSEHLGLLTTHGYSRKGETERVADKQSAQRSEDSRRYKALDLTPEYLAKIIEQKKSSTFTRITEEQIESILNK